MQARRWHDLSSQPNADSCRGGRAGRQGGRLASHRHSRRPKAPPPASGPCEAELARALGRTPRSPRGTADALKGLQVPCPSRFTSDGHFGDGAKCWKTRCELIGSAPKSAGRGRLAVPPKFGARFFALDLASGRPARLHAGLAEARFSRGPLRLFTDLDCAHLSGAMTICSGHDRHNAFQAWGRQPIAQSRHATGPTLA